MKQLQTDTDSQSISEKVSKHRQAIKQIIAAQFDPIIDDAYREVAEAGEPKPDDPESRRLMKNAMAAIVDELLDDLEGNSYLCRSDEPNFEVLVGEI